MKDPYQQMLEEAMSLLLFIGCLVVAVFTQGCTTQVLPNVKIDSGAIKQQLMANHPCPGFTPRPIPQDVVIDIFGDKVQANQGGENLLRDYVRAQQCLRSQVAPSRAAQAAK
jgi:hypothetical protein